MGATGLEQSAKTLAKPQIACKGAAKSAATSVHSSQPDVHSSQPDSDLARLADSWSRLPPSVKAGIVAMVKAVTDGDYNKIAPGS